MQTRSCDCCDKASTTTITGTARSSSLCTAHAEPLVSFVDDLIGDTKLEGIRVRNVLTDEVTERDVTGLFVAIGHRPNTDLFKGVIEMDKAGYIVPVEHTMTNIPGVFAAGDVTDHRYRQAVTAAGDGCRAAIDLERWLESQGEDVGGENWN